MPRLTLHAISVLSPDGKERTEHLVRCPHQRRTAHARIRERGHAANVRALMYPAKACTQVHAENVSAGLHPRGRTENSSAHGSLKKPTTPIDPVVALRAK